MAGSLRLKLTITYLLVVTISMATLGVNLPFLVERRYASALEAELRAHAEPTRRILSHAMLAGANQQALLELCRQVKARTGADVVLLAPDGRTLARTTPKPHPTDADLTRATSRSPCKLCHYPSSRLGPPRLDVPLTHGGRVLGTLRLLPPEGPMRQVEAAVRGTTLLVSIGAALLAALVSLGLAATIARPIAEMNRMAGRMAQGDLNARVPVLSHDEVGALAASLNRMAESLKLMVEARRRFLADVSHELRTPVAAIRSAAEVLTSGAADDPESRERFLKALCQEADRLSSLVDDLLDLERIDAGRLNLQCEPFPLAFLVEKVTTMLAPLAKSHGVTLSATTDPDLWLTADALRVEQVLVNLLENAIKYTQAGGSVCVAARRQDDKVLISVADTGIGIPEEDLPKVFERFYRVDRGRSRRLGGTGLGLAIVREIVEAHGGCVRVESTLGKGSTFSVELPSGHNSVPDASIT